MVKKRTGVIGRGTPLSVLEPHANSRKCVLLGAGGHAKVVVDALKSRDLKIDGVVAPELANDHSFWRGLKVLGDDDWLIGQEPKEFILLNGVGGLPGNCLRQSLFDRFKSAGFEFQTVIHPNTTIGSEVTLGEGSQIMAGVVLQVGSHIGDNTIINTGATVDHDCQIGKSVHIAPGVNVSGEVVIEDEVHLGTGASVIQGVTIGMRSIVGAGTVVVQSLPMASKVVGPKPRLTVIGGRSQ